MCNADKAKFVTEVGAVKDTIRRMETPIEFTPLKEFTVEFDGELASYLEQTGPAISTSGNMSPLDMAKQTAWLHNL